MKLFGVLALGSLLLRLARTSGPSALQRREAKLTLAPCALDWTPATNATKLKSREEAQLRPILSWLTWKVATALRLTWN